MNNPEPLIDVARGDVGLSRYLKDTLRLLASNTKDTDLQQQIRDISAGRAGLHTLLQSETFKGYLDQALPAAEEEAATRSQEELHRLAAEGEVVLQRYRDQPPNDSTSSESAGPNADPVAGTGDRHRDQPSDTPAPSTSHVIPGTRRPNRDLVIGPSDLDDDDQYFDEQRGRGWLQ